MGLIHSSRLMRAEVSIGMHSSYLPSVYENLISFISSFFNTEKLIIEWLCSWTWSSYPIVWRLLRPSFVVIDARVPAWMKDSCSCCFWVVGFGSPVWMKDSCACCSVIISNQCFRRRSRVRFPLSLHAVYLHSLLFYHIHCARILKHGIFWPKSLIGQILNCNFISRAISYSKNDPYVIGPNPSLKTATFPFFFTQSQQNQVLVSWRECRENHLRLWTISQDAGLGFCRNLYFSKCKYPFESDETFITEFGSQDLAG